MYIPPPNTTTNSLPAPSQLQSIELARVMHLISEGECGGLANATYPGNSIYFNNTPLQDTSGNWQFGSGTNVPTIAQCTGTPTQLPILGFSAAENTISIGTQIFHATPVTQTTSASNIDAVRLTIQFPVGLQLINSSTGEINPDAVKIQIATKLTSSGTWTVVITDTISGKADPNFEKAYQVNRPTGSGTWDVQVTRVTADTTTPNTESNQTWLHTFTEIQDVNQSYPNSGYVALTYDSKIAPSPWPETFDWLGIKIAVPSNYNPTTRVYTGIWDGTMSATQTFTYNTTTLMWDRTYTGTLYTCDNPVWILYDLLINKRYGLGEVIDPSIIDLAGFYAAGVYCDGSVTINSTTEPRFRFNCQIANQDDPWKVVQMLASTFNAVVLVSGTLVTLSQDRPTSASVLVTRADISEEGFTYSSSASSTRYTAAKVTYNDSTDSWIQKSVVVKASDLGISTTFPYNCTTAVAWGCTSEGQARRIGRWLVDSSLNNTDIIQYKAPLSHANVIPGTVIEVMDDDWANTAQGAQVVSATSSTVVLDRPVTISSGTNTLTVLLADGLTLGTVNITTGAGSTNTLSIATAFAQSVTPGATAIVTGAVSPRQFRITDVVESDDGFFAVQGLQYDPTKYSRIETGVSTVAPIYADLTSTVVPTAVSAASIVFDLNSPSAVDTVIRNLTMGWGASANASTYTVQWSLRGSNQWTTISGIATLSATIQNVTTNKYDFNIYAVSKWGVSSPVVSALYQVDLTGTVTPSIYPVTALSVLGGGTTFTGQDCTVVWTNPTTNAGINPSVKDFIVNVYTTGGTLLRTETAPGVLPGITQTYTYSYSKNLSDGGPNRSFRIDVIARDTLNSTVSATSVTVTNPVPSAPSGITVTPGIGANMLAFTLPTDTDFKGSLVWRGTTSGFTPSANPNTTTPNGGYIYDGAGNFVTDAGLTAGTTYYYKLAAYDTFSKDLSGATLSLSGQYSATALSSSVGIPSGSTVPGTGSEGNQFYNTSNGQLYTYHAGAWNLAVVQVPSTGIVGNITAGQIASVAAGTITGSIADSQLAAISAAKVTGTLVDAQIAALSAGKVTGTIVGSQIAASTILGSNIAAGTITAGNIQSSTITTTQLAANAVTATNIAAGAVLASKIVVTDQTNLVSNPSGIMNAVSTTDGWSNFTSAGIATNIFSTNSEPYLFQTLRDNYSGLQFFPVKAGDSFYCEFTSLPAGGGAGDYDVNLGLLLYVSSPTISTGETWMAGATRVAAASGLQTSSGVVTVPTGYGYALVWLQISTPSVSNGYFFKNIKLIRRNAANLIVDGTITATQIAAGTITGSNIAANTITSSNIVANTITAGQIAASTITTAQIAANTITASNIAAATITAAKIVSGTITATQIAANTITAAKIAAGTITSTQIAANTITASNMSVSSLSAISANLGSATIAAGGSLSSGQTAYNTGTGWWLGNTSGTPQFSIGSSTGNNLTWDGTNLTISANQANTTFAGANVTLPSQWSTVMKGYGATAVASFSVNTDGTLTQGSWYVGGGTTIGNSYWVFVSKQSGGSATLTYGTMNTWLALSSNRLFSLSATNTTLAGTYLIYISSSSSGTPVVCSGVASLEADSYTGAIP